MNGERGTRLRLALQLGVTCFSVLAGLSLFVLLTSYRRAREWDGITCCDPLDGIEFFWLLFAFGAFGVATFAIGLLTLRGKPE